MRRTIGYFIYLGVAGKFMGRAPGAPSGQSCYKNSSSTTLKVWGSEKVASVKRR